MMSRLLRARVGRLPDLPTEPGDRGPTGRWPDNTPAYDTTATTTITGIADLPAALANANEGDVIEVGASDWDTGSNLTISNVGNAAWEQRVLVRPPLGQRSSVRIMDRRLWLQDSDNIIFAGFKFAGNGSGWLTRTDRCGMAWMEFDDDGRGGVSGATNTDLYEFVREEMMLRETNLSAIHLWRNSGEIPTDGLTAIGWWHAGQFRPEGTSNFNKDTLQTQHINPSGVNKRIDVIDSVIFSSTDKVYQNNNDGFMSEDYRIINCWMNRPGDPWHEVPEG